MKMNNLKEKMSFLNIALLLKHHKCIQMKVLKIQHLRTNTLDLLHLPSEQISPRLFLIISIKINNKYWLLEAQLLIQYPMVL